MPARTDLRVYTLHVFGLFGRNRSQKSASFKLHEVSVDAPMSDDDVRVLMTARLDSEKVKPGASCSVVESFEFTEDRANGVTVRGFQLAGARTIVPRFIHAAPKENA